ncbi:MAG: CDP-alcohol phosphatidyltransferase family protein [Pseudomonadota bacterium]
MFDAKIRILIDPPLNAMGRRLAGWGIAANAVTLAGFVSGMAGTALIAFGHPGWALVVILCSRLADGLDGAVARATQKTDLGGFLDIVLDFIFYGAVPLAFAVADPAGNALPAAVLLLSYFANGSTFLAYAIMAAKQEIETSAQGVKSLYYMTGLAEGGETIVVIILFCLFPAYFPFIAYGYAALCYASATGRIVLAYKTLK